MPRKVINMPGKRKYIFTLNNPSADDIQAFKNFTSLNLCRFMIFQGETAASGTPHLQGYLELREGKTVEYLKRNLHNGAHFEGAFGSSDQNIHYCKKPIEGCTCEHCTTYDRARNWYAPFQYGTPASTYAGASFWEVIRDALMEGQSIAQIIEAYPSAGHFVTQLLKLQDVLHEEEVCNKAIIDPSVDVRRVRTVWIVGESGVGKSAAVHNLFPKIFTVGYGKNMLDHYLGQEAILIDDMYEVPLTYMLKLLDVYPTRVTRRYSDTWNRWNQVFITSTLCPDEVYGKESRRIKELMRRINVVYMVEKPGMSGEREFIFNDAHFPSLEAVLMVIPYLEPWGGST